jgi:hypothetical protein
MFNIDGVIIFIVLSPGTCVKLLEDCDLLIVYKVNNLFEIVGYRFQATINIKNRWRETLSSSSWYGLSKKVGQNA